jgi:high-affinity iron transporter
MLPTFVIGLREGLEAALIVGIIAAFLRKQGRLDLLRWVFAGVGVAIVLCLGVGVALEVLSRDLPQRQQEGLETVVGGLAVAMVTYMVVWMRRHSRELKGSLESAAATALADGSDRAGRALVVMAFLAVLREGFETVVFLLAAFNESGNGAPAATGAVLGIVLAIGLGWGIYRGGVRLNLSKFFRATGLVLVLVAAGLVLTAFHTAHEAGWLTAGQSPTVDLSWLVRPGSVQASLLTGMLGVQAHPVRIEVVAWLAYLVPVGIYVAWPPGRPVATRRIATATGVIGAGFGVAAAVLAVLMPAVPAVRPTTVAGSTTAHVVSAGGDQAVVRLSEAGSPSTVTVRRSGSATSDGLDLDRYTATRHPAAAGSRPSTLSVAAVARLNGGRLPLGLTDGGQARVPVTYAETSTVNVELEPHTLRVVSATWTREVRATARAAVGQFPLATPVVVHRTSLPATAAAAALTAARADVSRLDRRDDRRNVAAVTGAVAAVLLVGSAGLAAAVRRRPTPARDTSGTTRIGHQVRLT